MQKKKSRLIGWKLKLRCPNCGERINHELTSKEFRLYGHAMLPKVGDLTSCDGCDTVLEYASDPAALVLKLAPQWRVDIMNDLQSVPPKNPTLSEMVDSVRNRKPVRLKDYSPR